MATRTPICPRCGRDGEYLDWRHGHYCPTCNVPADAKKRPHVRGHWCAGLQRLQEGIYTGMPRLTEAGTLISVGDEYADEETEVCIEYCPMCGVKIDG